MKERLTRLAIIVLVAFLTVGVAKAFSDWQRKQTAHGGSLTTPIQEKVEDLGNKILGSLVEKLPGAPDLADIPGNQSEQVSQGGEVYGDQDQTNSEAEPIEEPVQNIQKQTETLIETVKELPQDQIKAIKKQIYKDFCEKLLEEEKNE